MEAIIIVIFSFILLSCILAGYSILWALLFGYMMFFSVTPSGRDIRRYRY